MKLGRGDTVAILGDSGSTGCCVAYSEFNPQASRKQLGFEDDDWQGKPYAWVNRLQQGYPGLAILNYSGNGWQARSHLDEGTADQAVAAQPTVVLIPLGINDYGNGRSPEQFADDLREIIARFAAGSPRTHIVLITEWCFRDEANRTELGHYWAQMTRVARENGLGLVEWHRYVVIPDRPSFLAYRPADERADDMHPNGAENAVMARLVRRCLDAL